MVLRKQVEVMHAPLEYFNELERIGPLLGVPINVDSVQDVDINTVTPTVIKVHPGSDQFVQVLSSSTRPPPGYGPPCQRSGAAGVPAAH